MRAMLTIVLLGSCLAATAWAQSFYDDFSDGDDADWTRVDLLDAGGLGPTIYDPTSGRYSISSSAVLPQLPLIIATGSFLTDSLVDPPLHSNGVARAVFRSDNEATNLAFAVRFAPTADAGYFFFLDFREGSHAGGIGISSLVAGAGAFTNLAVAPLPLDQYRDYIAEATFIGAQLSLRVWPADESEPATPQLSVINADHSVGGLGLAVYNQPEWAGGIGGQISGSFDEMHLIPEPGSGLLMMLAAGFCLKRRSRARSSS